MAQTVVITDDLDGTAGATTVSFTVDGVAYELDLADKNRDKFDKALAPYIDAARRPSGSSAPQRRTTARRRESSSDDLAAIRSWAKEHGHQVSDRGRIAKTIVEAYHAAS